MSDSQRRAHPDAVAARRGMGHKVVRWKGPLSQRSAHCIGVAGLTSYLGVGDRRRTGVAVGY